VSTTATFYKEAVAAAESVSLCTVGSPLLIAKEFS
jgi:hypothetical protein